MVQMPGSRRRGICFERSARGHVRFSYRTSITRKEGGFARVLLDPDAQTGRRFVTRQRKFLTMAIEHFTKWVEVEAMSDITSARVKEFFWKQIVCHFGLPRVLIGDNGKQFDCKKFRAFCAKSNIDLRFTSVTHPQSNGMTKVTN
ncbi:uncharacterized protein LOC126668377 [Mercurialis annua]|uniref:uncharacterized protein LOC126668377 n=1 Tax=Mercurialis annua TaxID=3986 RepID=UPI00215ED6C4|nr:uncharacterized protein LOC126668377 [Mercurialis annua]